MSPMTPKELPTRFDRIEHAVHERDRGIFDTAATALKAGDEMLDEVSRRRTRRRPSALSHGARLHLDKRGCDCRRRRNTVESVIRTLPLLVTIGCCASIRWLNVCGTAVSPAIRSEASGPGGGAEKM